MELARKQNALAWGTQKMSTGNEDCQNLLRNIEKGLYLKTFCSLGRGSDNQIGRTCRDPLESKRANEMAEKFNRTWIRNPETFIFFCLRMYISLILFHFVQMSFINCCQTICLISVTDDCLCKWRYFPPFSEIYVTWWVCTHYKPNSTHICQDTKKR